LHGEGFYLEGRKNPSSIEKDFLHGEGFYLEGTRVGKIKIHLTRDKASTMKQKYRIRERAKEP